MKIGIIGSGGAGMCAAWLLDEHHEVTLFEKKNYLGGNTHTVRVNINGNEHLVDDGAAWFSPSIYPYLNSYMNLAGIEWDLAPMSLTFHNRTTCNSTCMPPVELKTIYKMFSQKHVLPQLLALNKMLNACKQLVDSRNTTITYQTFMQGINVSAEQKENFLKPLLTGLWGVPYSQTADFCMYPLVKYIVSHKPAPFQFFKMKVMRGGCDTYINTVAKQLKHTNINLNDGVVSISTNEKNNQVRVTTDSGNIFELDRLIITAGACDARNMFTGSVGLENTFTVLQKFKYYKALLATHSDISFMPPYRNDWSVVNVMSTGDHAAYSIWSGQNSNIDLFCSYVRDGEIPNQLHHLSEWWLPCETPDFFKAQKELETIQGQHNIWFAGDYTNDIGSHEDAILSAVKAVEQIAPSSARLNKLINASKKL